LQSHRHRRGSHVPWGVFFCSFSGHVPRQAVVGVLSMGLGNTSPRKGCAPARPLANLIWGHAPPSESRWRDSFHATGTWFGLCVVIRAPSAVRPCLQRCQVEARAARRSESWRVEFERLTVPRTIPQIQVPKSRHHPRAQSLKQRKQHGVPHPRSRCWPSQRTCCRTSVGRCYVIRSPPSPPPEIPLHTRHMCSNTRNFGLIPTKYTTRNKAYKDILDTNHGHDNHRH
jgi:hypothetical protein